MSGITDLRSLYESRRLDEARAEYTRCYDTNDPELHLYGALIAWRQERHRDSLVALQRAFSLDPTGSVKARCHFMAGILAREAGDSQAVAEFDACLAMLPDLPELDGLLRGACLYNKGLAKQFMRDGKLEALVLYQQAIREFEATGMDDYRRQALQNAAWVCVDLGDFAQAAELLDEAAPLCLTEPAQWVQRVTFAHLHGQQNEWTEAARLCHWILSGNNAAADVRCLAAAVAADTLLRQGNVTEAEVMGQHAVSLALQTADNRCMSVATRVHTKAKQANAGAS